jgi:hypothetical protein
MTLWGAKISILVLELRDNRLRLILSGETSTTILK